MNHCECQEEGTRNVVAECLGKLTLVNAEELLPKLKKYLSSESALIRSTVVTAIKFTISDQVGGSTGLDVLLWNCGLLLLSRNWYACLFEYKRMREKSKLVSYGVPYLKL